MIRANCKVKLTPNDMEFIISTLSQMGQDRKHLRKLLTDDESLDQFLDSEILFEKMTNARQFTNISPYLYFCVTVRKVLRDSGFYESSLADYIADLLAEFREKNSMYQISKHDAQTFYYLVDMLEELTGASSERSFLLHAHIGNYSLFLTGIFPDYVYQRSTFGRAAPNLRYYEDMGRSNYYLASTHPMSEDLGLKNTLEDLSDRFHDLRIVLNTFADEYLDIDRHKNTTERLLRQALYNTGR